VESPAKTARKNSRQKGTPKMVRLPQAWDRPEISAPKIAIFNHQKMVSKHIISGWWFQTFFIFNNMWDNPSH